MQRFLSLLILICTSNIEAQILLRSVLQEHADADKKMLVRSDNDGQLFDGKITSYPPDQRTFERKVESAGFASWHFPVSPNFRMRPSWTSRLVIEKKFDENTPRRIEERSWQEHRPAIDLTYVTAANLEILGGYEYFYFPKSEGSTESASFEETSEYGETKMGRFRGGIFRRSSFFSAGVLYQSKAEAEQSLRKRASDGSELVATKVQYTPLQIDVFARSELGGAVADVEFSAIQASEGGPKASDSGETIYDDHLRIKLGCLIPLDKSTTSLHLGLTHRTLSYADSAFISVDTIPISSFHAKWIQGSWNRHFYVGAMFGYGQDTQSLPEFNQKFEVLVVGGQAGVFTDF